MTPASTILCAALAARPTFFPSLAFVKAYQVMKSEKDELVDWLKKNNPDVEVVIHPNPKLKGPGWERVPLRWKGQQIWIRQKPDKAKHRAVEVSA
jgi:aromatic ring-cleaving dioxygenase